MRSAVATQLPKKKAPKNPEVNRGRGNLLKLNAISSLQ
jgi:hypothetical protein